MYYSEGIGKSQVFCVQATGFTHGKLNDFHSLNLSINLFEKRSKQACRLTADSFSAKARRSSLLRFFGNFVRLGAFASRRYADIIVDSPHSEIHSLLHSLSRFNRINSTKVNTVTLHSLCVTVDSFIFLWYNRNRFLRKGFCLV